jgi:hypothetical protein
MSKLLGNFFILVGFVLLGLSVQVRVQAAPGLCSGDCTQSSTVYFCASGLVFVYQMTDCTPCQGGTKGWTNCQPPANGGTCKDAGTGKNPITVYPSGFQVCTGACQALSIGGTTPSAVQGFPTGTKGVSLPGSDMMTCQ